MFKSVKLNMNEWHGWVDGWIERFDKPSLVRNWINSTAYRSMSSFAILEIMASEGIAFLIILDTVSLLDRALILMIDENTHYAQSEVRDQRPALAVYICQGPR